MPENPEVFQSMKNLGATCQHGTAWDVHCCGCHSGFLFDTTTCACLNDTTKGPPDIPVSPDGAGRALAGKLLAMERAIAKAGGR